MTQQGDRRRCAPYGCALAALAGVALAACSTGSVSNAATSTPSPTAPGDSTAVDVVKTVTPSVVLIQTSGGIGSGEVYDSNGDIVTNAHVVGTATTFVVSTSTGRQYQGTLVGSFSPDDIAVINVHASGLRPARFGDSSRVEPGESVLAIGNPLGFEGSVTSGVVSAVGRVVSMGPNGPTLPDAIQISAPINPGNSGGALVDLASEVIGIPTLAALNPATQAPASGIGFAISSNRAKFIAAQLVRSGRVTESYRADLGIEAGTTSGGQGVLVLSVQPGGPADRAGIVAGTLITSVAGRAVTGSTSLATVLATLDPGQTVPVVTVPPSSTTKTTVNVMLGELPG